MRLRYYWWIILLFFSQSATEQMPNFIAPVKGTMQLTGTFGELRTNHFHAGLDIRGGVGRPLYAIADGFVSRIYITVAGYGQALYLEHPSGHTSVYGHMDRFRDDIQGYVRARQYEEESFTLSEELKPERFPVKQGDLIGYIGKRGYAFGPHLHFEIRDTKTDRRLNPMNFGITVPDRRRPFINNLRVYALSERGRVLKGNNYTVRGAGAGRYRLLADTLWVDHPVIAFGIKSYDQQDGRPNYNGIYGLAMWQDSSLRFSYNMDDFQYEQTLYLNAHLDYAEQQQNSWFQRAFALPGNQLDFYQTDSLQGRINLAPGQASEIRFRIVDHRQNATELNLVVKREADSSPLQNPVYTYYLPYDEESIIENDEVRAHFPESALYEDLYLDYDYLPEASNGIYAAVHRFHNNGTPLHRYYDLHIRPTKLPEALRDKAVIAHCEDGRDPVSYGGEWTSEGCLRAPVRAFGNFTIMADTIPPTIEIDRFSSNMRGWTSFGFILDDNFPTSGKARRLRFRGEVDNQWILMEYDGRKRRLYHTFDDRIPSGEHELVLRVMDDRGNETVLRRSFTN
ncbi:MAG: M23 family metallopeptidase [Bacteroidota bacterium]